MSFYLLYIFIPVIIFFLNPTKKNNILIIYWFIICIISYDNVSDYRSYYILFSRFKNGFGLMANDADKEIEFAWNYVFYLFSFTKYGNVLIHSIVLSITSFTFYKYSKKYDILNFAILMYFLMALVVLHDNIMRQDIAICLAYPAYYLILDDELKIRNKVLKIIILTIIAFFFHYSAVFLLPFYFLIRPLSKLKLNYVYVLFTVLVVGIVFAQGVVMRILLSLSVALSGSGIANLSDFSLAMDKYLVDNFDFMRIVTAVFFCFPLIYFRTVSKCVYEQDRHLRLCVNMSCFVMVWKCYFGPYGITIFTRPVDYLIWFAVWGNSYMLRDIYLNKRRTILPLLSSLYIILYMYVRVQSYSLYFGDNNYMTIFSQECIDQKYYIRDLEDASKRIR